MPLDEVTVQPSLRSPKNPDKLALVIPTYHETGNILVLLDRVKRVLDCSEIRYEILVVDDDSRDGIADVVTAVSQADPRVRLLVRQGERGLAGAILHGWQHTDADILGVMDADMQHPPDLLPALHRAILEGRDLAIGSRYAEGGGLGGWNPARKLASAAAVWMTRPLQQEGLQARDPMSGFFLIRSRCLDGVLFQKSGFKLLLEILVRGRVRSVQEIPFTFGRRYAGRSKAGINVALDYFALLFRLYRERYGLGRPAPTFSPDH
jgi:dolichol-phosphate mannosyltransferase